MTLTSTFIQHLLTLEALTELVDDRVYGKRSPPGAPMPRVNVEAIQAARMPHMRGQSGLVDGKVRISFVAATEEQAAAMAAIVRLSGLDGFRGILAGTEADGLDMQHVLLEDEGIADDPSPGLESQSSFTVAQDFSVMHREASTVPAFATSDQES